MIGLLLLGLASAAPVTGRVVERGGSSPVAGVEVRVDGRPDVAARSSEDGSFTLNLPPDLDAVLTVSDPGYLPLQQTVRPPQTDLRLRLDPVPAGEQIVVESFRATAHPTVHRLDAEQAYKTPGTQDDVVRLVQALPGVAVQREFSPTSGDISVRGSAPGDNRVYLDGVEIPYLYHFNQYASVFPTTWLRGLELYPSTFGAKYGDAVGAVIEAESRLDPPTSVEGQLTFNTVIAGADVRAPVGRGWWVAAAARRSYQDLYSGSTAQYTVWPVFHDLALRVERGDADRGTGLFFVRAGDSWDRAVANLDLLDPVQAEESPSLRYRRRFHVLGLRHRWKGDRAQGRLVVGLVHDDLSGRISTGGAQEQRGLTLSSRLDAEGRIGDGENRWYAGWELRSGLHDVRVDPAGDTGLLATEAPALGRRLAADARLPRAQVGVYAQAMLRAGPVRILPGARVGLDSLTGAVLPAPRLAARWRVGPSTALKIAGGHYRQTPQVLDLVPGIGDPDLPITRSWQASAGWEQTIAQRLELNLDAYVRDLRDAQVFRPDARPEIADRGRALGAELVTRYRLRDRFFLWGWVGLSSARVLRPDGWHPTAYDQPINLGFVSSWDLDARWNVSLRWRYGSGLPWTPVQGSVYDASDDLWRPVLSRPNSARMPAYTKLDVGVKRSFVFDRWTLDLRAELWVVPPSSNVLYPTYSDDWTEQGWVRGIPLLPLLGARATF